jgi:hypothetical protein
MKTMLYKATNSRAIKSSKARTIITTSIKLPFTKCPCLKMNNPFRRRLKIIEICMSIHCRRKSETEFE